MTFANAAGWTACTLALASSALLALRCRASAWGWVGFLGSNVAWIAYALATGTPSLLIQNFGFTATSLLGIYRHRVELAHQLRGSKP
jgi:hypothetical protein